MHWYINFKPFLHSVRSSILFIYIVINLAVFTDAYLYGLIIPVLPFALVERVNLREDEVQKWIGILLAAYGAGLIVGSPIAGWFADRTSSRRGPYLLGLIALAASTVAFSLGRTTSMLFIGRLVQGGSSAIVHTVGMAIQADTVGQSSIGSAMGFVTMSIALGVVFGPILGGILYHQMGYLAVFVSAYALVALDFLLRVVMIMPSGGTSEKGSIKSDSRSYGTFPGNNGSGAQDSADVPEDQLNQMQQSSAIASSSLSVSSDSTSTSSHSLIGYEDPAPTKGPPYAHQNPLVTLVSSPRMLAAILGVFMQSTILTGLESILPLRIRTLFDYNSMQVALVFLTLSLPCFAGPIIGHVSDRIGAKIMVCLGFLLMGPLLILLRLVDHNGEEVVALLCMLLLLTGVALNMILTPVFSEAVYVVDDQIASEPGIFGTKGAYAQAFGLMNVAYAAGSLVGQLMGGFFVESVGWSDLTLGTGTICAICVMPCLYATGGRQFREQRLSVEGS